MSEVRIFQARYGGAYERPDPDDDVSFACSWVATWAELDGRETGDDTSCDAWFTENRNECGFGDTPDAALADLERRQAEQLAAHKAWLASLTDEERENLRRGQFEALKVYGSQTAKMMNEPTNLWKAIPRGGEA